MDEGLYLLLSWVMMPILSGAALNAVSIVIARIVSSIVNFYMNMRLVFRSSVNTFSALWKYTALAVPQLVAQLGLTVGICALFGIGDQETVLRGIVYALVMTVLFFASFFIQQRWVFKNNPQA